MQLKKKLIFFHVIGGWSIISTYNGKRKVDRSWITLVLVSPTNNHVR